MRTQYFGKMVIWPSASINSVACCDCAREGGKWCLADINLHDEAQAEHLWLGRCGREELGIWSCAGWAPARSVLAGRWLLLSVRHRRLKGLLKVLWSRGGVQGNAGERFSLPAKSWRFPVRSHRSRVGSRSVREWPCSGFGAGSKAPPWCALRGEPGFDIPGWQPTHSRPGRCADRTAATVLLGSTKFLQLQQLPAVPGSASSMALLSRNVLWVQFNVSDLGRD